MPRYPFLDYQMPMYVQHLEAWKREERRLYGGDAVLTTSELVRWTGETDLYYAARVGQARYLNFPKIHASTLVGHISQQTPMPNYGALGEIRSRDQLGGARRLAELIEYNADGIGQDGTELRVWFDGAQVRACATGYRLLMSEMPSADVLDGIRSGQGAGASTDGVVTMQDVQDGFRPFGVEYSPLSAPFFVVRHGRLDAIVLRVPMEAESLVDANGNMLASSELGYYLLVRSGYAGLGSDFSEGGWWKLDPRQEVMSQGTWEPTRGHIPMTFLIGESGSGTTERPAIAQSLTMELGQIAIGLMNRISERDYNASQAAKSVNWILGVTSAPHSEAIDQLKDGSIAVGIPPVMAPDGSTVVVPQMWNSSAALLDSQAYDLIIKGGIEEAKEIMVRQVTSTPDSSGRSKEAGFAEATSPLLARLAASRQQAMNTFLYFMALRFGVNPSGVSVTIPREFDLAPVVDEIDAMLATLKQSGMRSPTWAAHLVLTAGDERGLLPEDKRAKIEAEMAEGAAEDEQARVQERSLLDELDERPETAEVA